MKTDAKVWVVSELYYPEDTSTGYFLTGIAEGLAAEFVTRVAPCGMRTGGPYRSAVTCRFVAATQAQGGGGAEPVSGGPVAGRRVRRTSVVRTLVG